MATRNYKINNITYTIKNNKDMYDVLSDRTPSKTTPLISCNKLSSALNYVKSIVESELSTLERKVTETKVLKDKLKLTISKEISKEKTNV